MRRGSLLEPVHFFRLQYEGGGKTFQEVALDLIVQSVKPHLDKVELNIPQVAGSVEIGFEPHRPRRISSTSGGAFNQERHRLPIVAFDGDRGV